MTLCDTGPLVALIDTTDQYHQACVDGLAALPAAPLLTTWPCFTEAMHLLNRVGGIQAQNKLWEFVVSGLVEFCLPVPDEWRRMHELMNQYADLPLDLADASLISASEQLGDRQLFSVDSRLRAVRIGNRHVFDVVP